MGKYRYFTDEEVMGLQDAFVQKLDQARGMAQTPFVITSGLRNLSENSTAGGVSDSSHLRGWAVDLACSDSAERFAIIRALVMTGFVRIGVYEAHIHVDLDSSLPQNTFWYSKNV